MADRVFERVLQQTSTAEPNPDARRQKAQVGAHVVSWGQQAAPQFACDARWCHPAQPSLCSVPLGIPHA